MNDLFLKAVDYCTYRLIKQSARWNEGVAHELHRTVKRAAVQMKGRTFSGKDHMSVIDYFQDFKSACAAYGINEVAALWLCKQYLTGPTEAAVESHVALPNSVDIVHEEVLQTYCEVVNIPFKRHAMDDNITNFGNEVQCLKTRNVIPDGICPAVLL